MAASENHIPKGIRNHGGEPERKSQVALVSQGRPKVSACIFNKVLKTVY